MVEMQSKQLAGNKPTEPTQKYLDISEIKEDTIVLKDGGMRAVVAVSSTNFALKSEDEQNALIAGFQSMLNSIDFPIQILIHSRVLDINGYLEKLRTLTAGQTNELLRIQMTEYIEYVGKLVEFANIMSKTFYVVVPHSATPAQDSFTGKLFKFFNPAAGIATKHEDFTKAKVKLEERVSHVVSELGTMGLRSIVLKTQELVELVYSSYNFDPASQLNTESLDDLDVNKKTEQE